MNRSTEPDFDPRIADWLEDDPNLAPSQALETVLAAYPIDPTAAPDAGPAEAHDHDDALAPRHGRRDRRARAWRRVLPVQTRAPVRRGTRPITDRHRAPERRLPNAASKAWSDDREHGRCADRFRRRLAARRPGARGRRPQPRPDARLGRDLRPGRGPLDERRQHVAAVGHFRPRSSWRTARCWSSAAPAAARRGKCRPVRSVGPGTGTPPGNTIEVRNQQTGVTSVGRQGPRLWVATRTTRSASAEALRPCRPGTWAATGNMKSRGERPHPMTLLEDGKVFVTGGFANGGTRTIRWRSTTPSRGPGHRHGIDDAHAVSTARPRRSWPVVRSSSSATMPRPRSCTTLSRECSPRPAS